MKNVTLAALLFGALLSSGCRQPDGAIPTLDAENTNRLDDIAKDLRRSTSGNNEDKIGLVDDLAVFADEHDADAVPAVKSFAGRVADAVVSARISDDAAAKMASTLWQLVGVTELSDRQVKALQTDLKSQLVSVGVPQDRADAVVAEMPTVQRAVTTRPRRWYEIF